MNDSVGLEKCLGNKCPNHCCSAKFVGLDKCLEYEELIDSGKPLLSDEEYKRIYDVSGNEYVEIDNGKPYLKVYEDNCCAAFKDGKCAIYEVRPDACRLYPFYFDQSCGFCKDKNCPGNFTTEDLQKEHYEMLKKRIDLFEKQLEDK